MINIGGNLYDLMVAWCMLVAWALETSCGVCLERAYMPADSAALEMIYTEQVINKQSINQQKENRAL